MLLTSSVLCGCTYTITLIHTQGTASDVVDETSSATPTTSVDIPISAVKP